MISLKESILSSTNAGITGVISEKIKDLIEKLNAVQEQIQLIYNNNFLKIMIYFQMIKVLKNC